MWRNTYKDYKPDDEWVQEPVEPGKGIVGCEMHELNGWGNHLHIPKKKKKRWYHSLFKKKVGNNPRA